MSATTTRSHHFAAEQKPMKLITFVHKGQYRLGALLTIEGHERVFDLNRLEPRLPADVLAFLEAGQTALALAQQTLPP
jgi:hypothetical protein